MSTHVYYQLVPLKIMEQIEGLEKGPFSNIPVYRRVYLYQIISVIAYNTRKKGEATALMTTLIKKAVPQGYDYLRGLMTAEIVERLGRYKQGEYSYKYTFSEEFYSVFKRIPLTDPKLIRRIETNKINRRRINKFGEQIKYIKQLKIDESVFDYLILRECEIRTKKDLNKFNAALASAIKIWNGDIFYSVDSTSHRFHSNLTNLPSALRQFVTINGKHLVNIDIKNSQPLIASLLLTDPSKCESFAREENFAMFLKTLQPINTEDSKEFIQLVTSGQIYEYLMKEFAKHGLNYDRDQMKKQFLIILFARNTIQNKQRKIFAELFPSVHKRFKEVRGYNKSKSKFKNSKRFPILLQTIEAHIILGRILLRIYKEHPGVIAVSIHDSVCTSIAFCDIETVKRIMKEEIEYYVAFQPTLKIERLTFSSQNTIKRERKEDRGREVRERDQYVSKTLVNKTELAS